MFHQHSHLPLRRLAVAILASLPLLASAQTIRGFSVQAAPVASDANDVKGAKFRTVANPIAGSYIVVLKGSTAKLATETAETKKPSIAKVADDMSAAYGGTLLHTYTHVLRGFAVQADDTTLARLLADPRVEYVQEDGLVTGNPTQTNATWGLDRIDQRNLPLNGTYVYSTTASNVRAYVLDSGLRSTHGEFTGRVGNGFTAINDGYGTGDCHGHGTHVAGTLGGSTWGVAKGVTIHPVRVLNCANSGSYAGIIAGVNWVAANHVKPAVANMSLGGGADPSVDAAVNNLINSGVTVVIAAGNSNTNACGFSPARVPAAITVGSTDSNDARSSFSNTGNCLDIFAPGRGIVSAGIASNTASATFDGTSMAAPHVAGAVALHLADNPTATPAQVAAAIFNNATPNKVTNAGSGSPNRLLHVPNTAPVNLPLRAGFSGAWYEPATSGQGFLVEVDPTRSLIFSGWYTFDVNGQAGGGAQQQRWYTAQSSYSPGDTSKTMTVFLNNGGNFDNTPTTQAVAIGTATISFQSCATGKFDYQVAVDGQNRTGSIPLTRLGSAQQCIAGTTPSYSLSQNGINPSLNGAWYEPRTSGQGFQFMFSPQDGNLVYLGWYTYDVNGQSGTGPSGQRWYTVQGNYTPGSAQAVNLPIYETKGGRFDVSPPTPTTTQVGTATLSFSSCNSASLTYNIAGRPSRTIPLTRLTGGAGCSP